MQQVDVERAQEFRKCIECFLCQNVCHVVRDHEENKTAFAGPRFLMRVAELDMHPLDTADRREHRAGGRTASGYCNITKCCTEVCPEHIKITDNALIPHEGARRRPQVRPDRLDRVPVPEEQGPRGTAGDAQGLIPSSCCPPERSRPDPAPPGKRPSGGRRASGSGELGGRPRAAAQRAFHEPAPLAGRVLAGESEHAERRRCELGVAGLARRDRRPGRRRAPTGRRARS